MDVLQLQQELLTLRRRVARLIACFCSMGTPALDAARLLRKIHWLAARPSPQHSRAAEHGPDENDP